MDLQAFNAGCNVLALEKNGVKYGMTCAWSSMLGYDKVAMLVGNQSETGKVIRIGDVVGISALASNQRDIAYFIGENHSTDVDKFKDIKYEKKDSAIIIVGAKVQIKAKVKNILHLDGMEEDNYIIFDVVEYIQNKKKKFLSAYE